MEYIVWTHNPGGEIHEKTNNLKDAIKTSSRLNHLGWHGNITRWIEDANGIPIRQRYNRDNDSWD